MNRDIAPGTLTVYCTAVNRVGRHFKLYSEGLDTNLFVDASREFGQVFNWAANSEGDVLIPCVVGEPIDEIEEGHSAHLLAPPNATVESGYLFPGLVFPNLIAKRRFGPRSKPKAFFLGSERAPGVDFYAPPKRIPESAVRDHDIRLQGVVQRVVQGQCPVLQIARHSEEDWELFYRNRELLERSRFPEGREFWWGNGAS